MQAAEIQSRVIKILTPYVKDTAALAKASPATNILEDLKVNSARLVDVVLAFATEREILEGPFNDVHEWQYEKLVDMIGGGVGSRVRTQREFETCLAGAFADQSQPHLLNVLLSPNDRSPGMVRLARRLGKKLSTDKP